MRRRSKYKAVRTNGFDSKGEAARAKILQTREAHGLIRDLEYQPKVYLSAAKILYKPDFAYTQADGVRVCEDYKGMQTPVFRLKARLWKFYGPCPLLLSDKRGVFDTITPQNPNNGAK